MGVWLDRFLTSAYSACAAAHSTQTHSISTWMSSVGLFMNSSEQKIKIKKGKTEKIGNKFCVYKVKSLRRMQHWTMCIHGERRYDDIPLHIQCASLSISAFQFRLNGGAAAAGATADAKNFLPYVFSCCAYRYGNTDFPNLRGAAHKYVRINENCFPSTCEMRLDDKRSLTLHSPEILGITNTWLASWAICIVVRASNCIWTFWPLRCVGPVWFLQFSKSISFVYMQFCMKWNAFNFFEKWRRVSNDRLFPTSRMLSICWLELACTRNLISFSTFIYLNWKSTQTQWCWCWRCPVTALHPHQCCMTSQRPVSLPESRQSVYSALQRYEVRTATWHAPPKHTSTIRYSL